MLHDIPRSMKRGMVKIGKRTADPRIVCDKHDSLRPELLDEECGVDPGFPVRLHQLAYRSLTVNGKDQLPALLCDPRKLRQPGVLIVLVQMREHALVEYQVEVS